ncbi:MAG: D-alanine--poly(phosphoribitol) ligase subunit DltA [Nannocystis sp.]|uniref:D-alanine--poly(phosphoribitol) ligase subunit DltA n=1 Tax=Nannocystis sp. TaxID=1962667 RepID=UPI0024229B15|nr:D-alanine--poly(phosphoribitol) ligase subunit DltA [Nannocystis sp.]MBK9753918.1 D-alanine--poly(phosphoribitol) ligase subunit DltA [Nannocystis sp.]
MIDVLAAVAAANPAAVAHQIRERSMTHGELAVRSDALATAIAARRPRGAPVVVRGHKEPEMLVAFLAAIKAGHPYVPIDDSLPSTRVASILRTCGDAALVLSTADIMMLSAGNQRPPLAAALRLDEAVYIMFTSGSTGEPKGVEITLANLAGFVTWASAVHPVGGRRRFLNQAPFSFDLSVMDLYLALTTGGTLVSVDRAMLSNPLELRAALASADLEVWVSTPSFAEMCLRDRSFNAACLPRLDTFLFCGETLSPACVRGLHTRFPGARVYNLYGPTEATVAVTSILVDERLLDRWPVLPLGRPRPDTRVFIDAGEIVIEGPCVSPGYRGAPELTARVFDGVPPRRRYRTGDAGHLDDGELFFAGRLDHQVKLFGHRIELDDVAANLTAIADVAQAVVLPIIREGRCEALAAFVVPREGTILDLEALRSELRTRMPAYMLPRDIRICDEIPMTTNGKVDRGQLATQLTPQ